MTIPRSATFLVLAVGTAFAPMADAGPITNLWNGLVGCPNYGCGYGYGAGYGWGMQPTYGYGYSGCGPTCGVQGCGFAPYAIGGCGTCGSTCGSSCNACSSCGSSNCGGNCVASAPSTKPEPDNPPRTFEEPYDDMGMKTDDGFESRGEDTTDEKPDPFEVPDGGTDTREALKPGTEESAIPMKKAAPTPEPGDDPPAAGEPAAVKPLPVDDRLVWTATPVRTRLDVRARFGSPRIARTRVTPTEWDAVPVSTRIAEK